MAFNGALQLPNCLTWFLKRSDRLQELNDTSPLSKRIRAILASEGFMTVDGRMQKDNLIVSTIPRYKDVMISLSVPIDTAHEFIDIPDDFIGTTKDGAYFLDYAKQLLATHDSLDDVITDFFSVCAKVFEANQIRNQVYAKMQDLGFAPKDSIFPSGRGLERQNVELSSYPQPPGYAFVVQIPIDHESHDPFKRVYRAELPLLAADPILITKEHIPDGISALVTCVRTADNFLYFNRRQVYGIDSITAKRFQN